jgi:alpha-tubulin suppressor-like RCC1 family protein
MIKDYNSVGAASEDTNKKIITINRRKVESVDKDPWGALEVLKNGQSEYQVVFAYSPLYDKKLESFVLSSEFTGQNCYLLLKNGILIRLDPDENGKKQVDGLMQDTLIPYQIKCPTKIVDVVCGRDHCLAKGKNYRVYSWGNNNYGQVKK